jgi:hypothetical protein
MMTIGHQKAKGELIMIKDTSVLVKNKSLDAQCIAALVVFNKFFCF